MSTLIKNNLKNILIVILTCILIPLMGIVINVIFTYGTYVGTYARNIIETGICN